ncbi:MAG: hypothetical protein HOY78_13900 [Saccharothrix sp.]|nr:hypothetical protein [Saccharothrix sp.]
MEPRPAIPVTVTTTPEPGTTTTPPPTTTSKKKPNRNNCDDGYLTDGVCVPWFFPLDPREACEWLREQGLTRIEVQGRDRHHLDLDLDGVACEWDED